MCRNQKHCNAIPTSQPASQRTERRRDTRARIQPPGRHESEPASSPASQIMGQIIVAESKQTIALDCACIRRRRERKKAIVSHTRLMNLTRTRTTTPWRSLNPLLFTCLICLPPLVYGPLGFSSFARFGRRLRQAKMTRQIPLDIYYRRRRRCCFAGSLLPRQVLFRASRDSRAPLERADRPTGWLASMA